MRGLSVAPFALQLVMRQRKQLSTLSLSLALSLLLAVHLLFLLLFVVHKMRRLVANCCDDSPGVDDADDDDGVAAAGRLRFAFNIQIVTLTSEIYYCSPISFSRWAGLSCGRGRGQEYPVTCLCHS